VHAALSADEKFVVLTRAEGGGKVAVKAGAINQMVERTD
jgi:hypothetical protein